MRHLSRFVLMGSAVAFLTSAAGGLSPSERCEAGKLQTAGKYAFCRLKAESKAAKTGASPDYSKCDELFQSKWQAIEAKAMGACPSSSDQAAIESRVTGCTDGLALALSGNAGAGRFIDDSDGTVTDTDTNLVWEKKVALDNSPVICATAATCPNPHDADNAYTWSGSGTAFDGTANTVLLAQLNDVAGGGANCFTGRCDWRLPSRAELESILDLATTSPAVDAVFHGPGCGTACTDLTDPACSCTALLAQWSSTTAAGTSNQKAWGADFGFAFWGSIIKTTPLPVRAVRGGL